MADERIYRALTHLYPRDFRDHYCDDLAAIIAVAQRSRLAHALRTPDSTRRRRRLTTAAKLGGFCLAILVVFRLDIYNDDSWGGRAVVYAGLFHVALVAAIVYLVAGLFTPRRPRTQSLPVAQLSLTHPEADRVTR